jgi:hypothetical protein
MHSRAAGGTGLTATRMDHQPRYSEKDIELYRLPAPHTSQAFAFSGALDPRTMPPQVLEAMLDAFTSGVYLTGFDGQIVYMNRAVWESTAEG